MISISPGLPYRDGGLYLQNSGTSALFDDEKLIIEVEKHTILYDKRNQHYFDTDRKAKVWGEIGEVLGVDGD